MAVVEPGRMAGAPAGGVGLGGVRTWRACGGVGVGVGEAGGGGVGDWIDPATATGRMPGFCWCISAIAFSLCDKVGAIGSAVGSPAGGWRPGDACKTEPQCWQKEKPAWVWPPQR